MKPPQIAKEKELIVIDDDDDDDDDKASCDVANGGGDDDGDDGEKENVHVDKKQKTNHEISQAEEDVVKPVNPFAQFAFTPSSTTIIPTTTIPVMNRRGLFVKTKRTTTKDKETTKTTTTTACANKKKKNNNKNKTKTKKEWVPMSALSLEERQRIRQKWHSMADASAPLEDRRFQVLVAARLHARCQDPVVRKSMENLGQAMTVNATEMASVDPDVLASLLTSLQYYNTKAQHLVKAAREIVTNFGGLVPEDENDLLTLTGIGPVMADLLANINTRDAHEKST